MTNKTNKSEEKLPVFKVVDGALVRKHNDLRDPKRRYAQVCVPEGNYLREFTDDEERQRDEEEARWREEAPQVHLRKKNEKQKLMSFGHHLSMRID